MSRAGVASSLGRASARSVSMPRVGATRYLPGLVCACTVPEATELGVAAEVGRARAISSWGVRLTNVRAPARRRPVRVRTRQRRVAAVLVVAAVSELDAVPAPVA